MRTVALCCLLGLCVASAFADPEGGPVVLLDFDTGEPIDGWDFSGVGLSETRVERGLTPSGGRALGIRGTEKGGHLVHAVAVADWRPFRAFSLFARVVAEAPIEMRLAAAEADTFRSRLKRFTLEPGGWREVVLPLSEFRWDFRRPAGRIDRVGRLLLQWDGGQGEVTVDDLRLIPGDRGDRSWLPTEDERLALAFPDGGGKAFRSDHFLVLTDVRGLDQGKVRPLLMRCEKGLDRLRERYRVPGDLPERVPLVVFRERADYEAFFVRVGELYRAGVKPGETDGSSALGYAASTWDEKTGMNRPVLVHEAMHAALERLIHLGSDGNWIQESLANAIQVHFHPTALKWDLAEKFRQRDRGERGFVPFSILVSAKRPGLKRYVQLSTVMEFLAESHADRLPAFWSTLVDSWRLPHESGPRALEAALGEPLERIGAAWIAWGVTRYRPDK